MNIATRKPRIGAKQQVLLDHMALVGPIVCYEVDWQDVRRLLQLEAAGLVFICRFADGQLESAELI